MLCCCKALSTTSHLSGLHQIGEHVTCEQAREVNMQREKNKREGVTANNWLLTFQFSHSISWTLLFGATCVVIIAPLEYKETKKRIEWPPSET